MLKGKFTVLSLGAAVLLCLQVASVNTVNSGIVSRCNSTAVSPGTYPADPSDVHFGCPKGDVIEGLGFLGLTITVTVKDNANVAIAGMPASDIWVDGCNAGLVLCGGAAALTAAAATDLAGMTTITGDAAVGGCDTGLRVIVQGAVLGNPPTCPAICLGIATRTPDFTRSGGGAPDLKVDIFDLSNLAIGFASKYQSPPKPYAACWDLASPWGTITLNDFAKFGLHYQHQC